MRVVSLFSGCGGADLGIVGGFDYLDKYYSTNSCEVIYANDIDQRALNTYMLNFKGTHEIQCGDIKEIETNKLPSHDLLVGGFPCQSFSTVNPTKNPYDERAGLYKEMIRVLKAKKPNFFIAENVKGFMTLQKGEIFNRVCKEFEEIGYTLSTSLINAADFGVPQKRERVFIVGVKKKYKQTFVFPEAPLSEEKGWVPLKRVIDKLATDDERYYFSERAVQGMKNAKNNMKRGLHQDLNGPCLTVTSHLAKVSLNSRDPVLLVDAEKELYRRFTSREAARIQSFPDTFEFAGSEADAYRQIGNAIPPVVMWHIINALKEQFPSEFILEKVTADNNLLQV